jgi:hypothetical protein
MTSPRTTGVRISANSATVLRWSPELTVRHHIDSTVPGRHRSTGRPPTEEHPGGEGHRDEHMRTFLDQVAHALPAEDDLLLVGDGEVVEHFADRIRTDDANHGRERRIEVERIGPLTERQLLARIRSFAGSPAKRYLPR